MGQSNSRASPAPETSTNDASHIAVAGSSGENQSTPPLEGIRDPSQSRRISARRSFLNLVKPSNIRSRVNSAASTPGDLRRSWRNSRRWSKAPARLVDSTSLAADSLPSSSAPAAGPSSSNKGKQRARSLFSEDDEETRAGASDDNQPFPSPTPVPLPDIVVHRPSSVAEASRSQSADETIFEGDGAPEEKVPLDSVPTPALEVLPDAPISSPMLAEPQEVPSTPFIAPAAPRPPTIPLPQRQFPPPGTLVVVQGIVHTTDVSRAMAPAPPGPATPAASRPASFLDVGGAESGSSRTRNRLSALLRPRSTSSRPSSVPPSVTITPPPETESVALSSTDSQSASEESAHTGLTTPPPPEAAQESYPPTLETVPPPETGLPSISSSSIDVLGTLLRCVGLCTEFLFRSNIAIKRRRSCNSRFSPHRLIGTHPVLGPSTSNLSSNSPTHRHSTESSPSRKSTGDPRYFTCRPGRAYAPCLGHNS